MKLRQPKQVLKLFPVLALTFGVLAPMPASATTVESCFYEYCTVQFDYTGATEFYTFPPSAINVTFEALGAQGGKNGGPGGRVTGSFNKTPSEIYVTVGGAGSSSSFAPGGFNGGGMAGSGSGVEGSGGGATDIRTSFDFSSRIVVAGGGGGRGSGLGSSGGAGGGLVSANGKTGQGIGGTGGTQVSGGIGGAANGPGTAGSDGTFGVGGAGGSGPLHGGGGGGGGYYGGGGGGPDSDSCCLDAGAGGGGSSYTDDLFVSNIEHILGFHAGDGQLIIRFEIGSTPPVENPGQEEPENPTEPTPPAIEPPSESTPGPNPEPTPPAIEPPSESTPGPTPEPTPESTAPEEEAIESPSPTEPEEPVTETPVSQVPSQDFSSPAPSNDSLVDREEFKTTAPDGVETKAETESEESISESLMVIDESITPTPPASEIEEQIQAKPELEQAAQTVIVPEQKSNSLWSSNTLLAGLIALGVFALLAGLIVARRGVPGAIAN
jgi:hypothetical protein